MKRLTHVCLLLALAIAAPAHAADPFDILDIRPSTPAAREPAHARVRIHGCDRIETVRMKAGVIRIERAVWESVCLSLMDVDIALGELPAGEHVVELGYYDATDTWRVDARRPFNVAPANEKPGIDLAGTWYATSGAGTGLYVEQRGRDIAVLVASFEAGKPVWYLASGLVEDGVMPFADIGLTVRRFDGNLVAGGQTGARSEIVGSGTMKVLSPFELELRLVGPSSISGDRAYVRF